jgi:hypothetical protein
VTDAKREEKATAARRAMDSMQRENDRLWLLFMATPVGTERSIEMLEQMLGLDAAILRQRRAVAELEGRAWLSAVP